jgi:hypothetical protein
MGNRRNIVIKGSVLLVALMLALPGAGAALSDDDCNVPMADWKSREAVQKFAEAQGWKLERIRIHDGCYDIRGVDAEGQPFKVRLDPGTLAIVDTGKGDDNGHHGDSQGSGLGPTDGGAATTTLEVL